MKNKDINNIFERPSMILFTLIIEYFLCVLIVFTLLKVVNVKNCFGLVQTISFSLPIFLNYFVYKKNEKKNKFLTTIIIFAIYTIIILLFPFIFGKTYDLTIDGNSYHKTAVAFLKNGWNPLYESSEKFQEKNNDIVKFDLSTKINLWINHYPKASWIIAANYYAFTNNIESGKCLSLTLMICVSILAFNLFSIFVKKKWAFILAILLALNPISVCQIFMYYVDGIMGSCFIIELLLLFMINPEEKTNPTIVILLTGICSIFINLKFTGLVYSGLIGAIFYFYWLFKYRKEKKYAEIVKRATRNFVIIFATSIFIVGSTSYVTNIINKGNPLYPLIGPDKVDIITKMQPKSFGETNNFVKFFWSLFSKTENVTYYSGQDPELKLPFTISRAEIESLQLPDTRIGGFGPLYALSFCFSIVMLIIGGIRLYKNEKNNLKYIIITLLSIIISMILVGESWWARYIPQLYILNIGSLLLYLYTFKYNKFKKVFVTFFAVTLLINVMNLGLFGLQEINYIKDFKTISSDIYDLVSKEKVKLVTTTPDLYGYYYNLKDYGVNYEVIEDIENVDSNKIKYVYCWRLEVINDEEVH